ncbi:two-component system, chemotaxis family, response regulator CheY [Desulfonatronum thiosulfatophilum]|uniref:Two-component system, chemotaxis family, response regulator CheY n=1 Tax=Desulfonatronum thiosulfatophilum TaxID=617002 RepID=A0A1G6D4R0_9BACT|nr:response regulator [Desulfonatronum thiosulfatophilum]SDB40156.1 two-component system, chemotaxis family, response regulator CheY [Desulfonatronum thiosulfatophilum]
MRTLIVEDSRSMREHLKEIVAPYGRVNQVPDGRQAVNAFVRSLEDKKLYDLILMDIEMPVLDGHKALGMIRRLEEQRLGGIRTKVVMVSSLSDYENILQAQFEERADAYITKPFEPKMLLETLGNLGLIDKGPFPEIDAAAGQLGQ